VDLSFLPAVNAALNLIALGLLGAGFALIRAGREEAHRRAMLAAFAVSALFLALYVAHKIWRGFENTHFGGTDWQRGLYLAMLASHVLLAMVVPVLALRMIAHGRAQRRAAHRRLAKFAWPIWVYVSVTGVLIYALLYHWNPALT
jgi:uncharacterized membrane protein YozB (DUF420 family)